MRTPFSDGRRWLFMPKALRPFESTYNRVKKYTGMRGHSFDLTYEDFLAFSKVPDCHYCGTALAWEPYLGNPRSNLDRKDNARGYSTDNCVPCCRSCNTI